MKNYILMAFMAFTLFACGEDQDLTGVSQGELELAANPLESMVEDDLASKKGTTLNKNANNTASTPVVISQGTFINNVAYSREICDATNPGPFALPYIGGVFRGNAQGGVSPAATQYRLTNDNCFELIQPSQALVTEFVVGTFYEIFGEVVRLSRPNSPLAFWFRDVDGTNQVQRVNFFEDGSVQFGALVDFPYDENADCSGFEPFEEGRIYRTGEGWISEGQFLFEVINVGNVQFTGICSDISTGQPGTDTTPDICAGIDPWQRGVRYRNGDEVTFDGYLFRYVRRGWRRIGECG